jgi:hypothetical protein
MAVARQQGLRQGIQQALGQLEPLPSSAQADPARADGAGAAGETEHRSQMVEKAGWGRPAGAL